MTTVRLTNAFPAMRERAATDTTSPGEAVIGKMTLEMLGRALREAICDL